MEAQPTNGFRPDFKPTSLAVLEDPITTQPEPVALSEPEVQIQDDLDILLTGSERFYPLVYQGIGAVMTVSSFAAVIYGDHKLVSFAMVSGTAFFLMGRWLTKIENLSDL